MFFPTTHWSLLAQASLGGETQARAALDQLCRRYWAPLNQFIRLRGYTEPEAEDLTQEFLLHLLEHSALRRPDPLRGKFRSFLLGALVKFLATERDRRMTQKRGGQHPHVSLEALPEVGANESSLPDTDVAAFDRAWALAVVRRALEEIERDYASAGKAELFAVLRSFLPGESTPPSYEEAAARAKTSLPAFNSEIHRLRQQFRECVRGEIMATVSAPHEIEEELTHLYRVLMDRGTDFRPAPES